MQAEKQQAEEGKQQKAALWTRPFIMLSLSNLFLFFGFQMLLPTLPTYVKDLGAADWQIGAVVGVFTLSALLIRPFTGAALGIFNRTRILSAGLIICFLTIGSYNYVNLVILVLLLRLVHGVGWGVTTTTLGTIVTDIIPQSRRGEGIGYYGMASTIAMAVGPMIGVQLINDYGFQALFNVSLGSTLISILLVLLVKVPPAPKAAGANLSGEKRPSLLMGVYEPKALIPSLLLIIITITYGGIVTYITLFGAEAGIANVGYFFSANAVAVFLVRPIAGKLFDRRGHFIVLLPGAFFGFAGILLLSYANSTASLVAAAFCYGISFGSIQPSLQAWAINGVTPLRRGAANAMFFSAFDLGLFIGSMLLGLLGSALGSYALLYRYASLCFILFLIIYLIHVWLGKRSSNMTTK